MGYDDSDVVLLTTQVLGSVFAVADSVEGRWGLVSLLVRVHFS